MTWIIGYFTTGAMLAVVLYSNGAYKRFATKALKEQGLCAVIQIGVTRNLAIASMIVLTILFWWIVLSKVVFISEDQQ